MLAGEDITKQCSGRSLGGPVSSLERRQPLLPIACIPDSVEITERPVPAVRMITWDEV
jgi:hypothetical protein